MHPHFVRTTDYFAIGSFDDWIIHQAEDTYIKSGVNGIKDVANGNYIITEGRLISQSRSSFVYGMSIISL